MLGPGPDCVNNIVLCTASAGERCSSVRGSMLLISGGIFRLLLKLHCIWSLDDMRLPRGLR